MFMFYRLPVFASSIFWTSSSNFAPFTSAISFLFLNNLNVGTVLTPRLFANALMKPPIKWKKGKKRAQQRYKFSPNIFTLKECKKKGQKTQLTLFSWLQSSFKNKTSECCSDNSTTLGYIILQGPHLFQETRREMTPTLLNIYDVVLILFHFMQWPIFLIHYITQWLNLQHNHSPHRLGALPHCIELSSQWAQTHKLIDSIQPLVTGI